MLREKSFLFFDLREERLKMGLPDIVAEDGSSLARRVSCLKFEPRVSNFPALESEKPDSSTAATMGSPFYLFIINLLVTNVSYGSFFLGFGNDDLLLFGVKQDIKYQLRKMNRYG